ncbi:MAG: hypothetical protein CMB64_07160 [Euryarchaeota archaeon]|nr:hypothetical protein [Euryarchaeota archaeon]
MTLKNNDFEHILLNKKRFWATGIVLIFLGSIFATFGTALVDVNLFKIVNANTVQINDRIPLSYTEEEPSFGMSDAMQGSVFGKLQHPALLDPGYGDLGVLYGKVNDLTLLSLNSPGFGIMLEEPTPNDHDNDGISDLNDLDDDNDGIYDLLERFDGCFGTDPYDHDNDGILDEFDWDDDNDGILEGPIDYEALESQGLDPRNVSTDRILDSNLIHPWTEEPLGPGYLADQNPFDHDNDGVADEDSDSSGSESFDEDDDNDGRIDQFKWPCDFDGDGVQDYFDDDDDNDGLVDLLDWHPYNASNITNWQNSPLVLFSPAIPIQSADYQKYSGGIDFIERNSLLNAGNSTFTYIEDGDLDNDGIPNFLDPDSDGDGSPNSADTDDDNDGLLDMWDPDDDNDGIPDVCINVDNNQDGLNDYTLIDSSPYQTPGDDTDDISGMDCEMDYDNDLDNDVMRPFDQNYNSIWDWIDPEMGGAPDTDGDGFSNPDNPNHVSGQQVPYDLDDDNLDNEIDSYMLTPTSDVQNDWNCPTLGVHNSVQFVQNPAYDSNVATSPECLTERISYSGQNDWDNDGILNWDDPDDDNDGIPDYLDIDEDCDLDNDADINNLNPSTYRDDGPNNVDSDIDGDGLENSIDWDDDNDGITDFYDPDDGNCGVVDFDSSDNFETPYYPIDDGGDLKGSEDSDRYTNSPNDFWNMSFGFNPFESQEPIVLNYNDGRVPEFYWFILSRWSSYNGNNEWDIDGDGDSLINGLDIDQDSDGLPDWFDQDEGNDGRLDVNDPKMGGTFSMSHCGWSGGTDNTGAVGFFCGYSHALFYHMPLNNVQAQFSIPYSTRPDPVWDQGAYDGSNSNGDWQCTPDENSGCYHIPFDQGTVAAFNYTDMKDDRGLFLSFIGLTLQVWTWNSDTNGNSLPDEVALNTLLVSNEESPDNDGDGYNDTVDLDDDYDSIYDWNDVDDDNDGLWDYFEVDTDFDLDDDSGTIEFNMLLGGNCADNDDDGNDADVNEDGYFNPVLDRGRMSQGFLSPTYYDVDNDNDGVPDTEDPDDDNDGRLDVDQEQIDGCFWGEESSPWDHDNNGIPNWADEDWDGDGRTNTWERDNGYKPTDNLVQPTTSIHVILWDHDNDGLRDDIDLDDDADGMKDEDEIMLWPSRFGSNSTNPWDHDDMGSGEALYNPNDNTTGPDSLDVDDDNDGLVDEDFDYLEENEIAFPCYNGAQSSDWDHDNDCILDEDDKTPTFVTLDVPDILWLDHKVPAVFSGEVTWLPEGMTQPQPAPNIPVQVHIEWAENGTLAVETVDVLTNANGEFTVGQFLYPEDLHVGDNDTYRVFAEVTEMFAFNGDKSSETLVGVRANTTFDYTSWEYVRSDEQPLWIDFKTHYTADWDRGIFDKRIPFAPVTFEISGVVRQQQHYGPFGNLTNATQYDAFGSGYRADSNGWASMSFVQENGANGTWKQVRWNSSLDNGDGQLTGGYELIIWNDVLKKHQVQGRYNYTNVSLPPGLFTIKGYMNPSLAGPLDSVFPYVEASETPAFDMKSVQRMYIEAEMIIDGTVPLYWWNSSINNGDGTFGSWSTLFHEQALNNAGITFNEARAYKPYPLLWDGNLESLNNSNTKALMPFIRANSTDWYVKMSNGAFNELPPCGPIEKSNPDTEYRCEIIPEVLTGDQIRVTGTVENRTKVPWYNDNIVLQVDVDKNLAFGSSGETFYNLKPYDVNGEAAFNYTFDFQSRFQAGTYGVRADFSAPEYYFSGDLNALAPTGAYLNVSVIGTTEFKLNTIPRLYRNTTTTVIAELIDNAGVPVKQAPIIWSWQAGGQGTNYTDDYGRLSLPILVDPNMELGEYELSLAFAPEGNSILKPSSTVENLWIVSQTFIHVESTTADKKGTNLLTAGDEWEFTAQVLDDNSTPMIPDISTNGLNGIFAPSGGLVDVIFEGISFNNDYNRQIVATVAPSGGTITLPTKWCFEDELTHSYDENTNVLIESQGSDGFWDRDVGWLLDPLDPSSRTGFQDETLDRYNEGVNCLKADIYPLIPTTLMKDDTTFLPDGYGPVNVILRYEEALPNEGCDIIDAQQNALNAVGLWDACVLKPGQTHYRRVLPYQANGFALVGNTELVIDDQVVYTSGEDPLTGETIQKPMVITGQLSDEMGNNLSDRWIRVSYLLNDGTNEPEFCPTQRTDANGYYSIPCEKFKNVKSGEVTVTVEYNSLENNDAYRYKGATMNATFDVFSNSTLEITEIGPKEINVANYIAANGTQYPVIYLGESFHIHAILKQTNGLPIGDCLNIYVEPEKTSSVLAFVETNPATGEMIWYSSDEKPSLRVEPVANQFEGLRTIRVAYEPNKNVPGGCEADLDASVNGSYDDIEVLVRSNVDLIVRTNWERYEENGYNVGDTVTGAVSVLRAKADSAIADEEVRFIRQYWNPEDPDAVDGWVTDDTIKVMTNLNGLAKFEWNYTGNTCAGIACDGKWRVIAYFPGSMEFVNPGSNITGVMELSTAQLAVESKGILDNPQLLLSGAILLVAGLLVGLIMYRRLQDRKRVEILRGILTDTMAQLRASNEYIAVIFNCYKDLVHHFRSYGFMKKVYETTREFESAVRGAFYMVPGDQLDRFLSIFEEARYSDHDIGPTHRDAAIQTLQMISDSITIALGEEGRIERTAEHSSDIHEKQVKAGMFKSADGSMIIQGQTDDEKEQISI